MIEFNRYNYGLGAGTVDVTPLAQAIDAGNLHPQFTQGLSCQAWWAPNGQPLDPQNYVDGVTALQIASLLGGSVVQKLPIDLQCTGMPLANFIQFSDGSLVNAGALASVAEYPSAATSSADRLKSIISQLTTNSFSDQWNAPDPVNPVVPVALPPATQISTPPLPMTSVTLPMAPSPVGSTCPSGYTYIPGQTLPYGASIPALCTPTQITPTVPLPVGLQVPVGTASGTPTPVNSGGTGTGSSNTGTGQQTVNSGGAGTGAGTGSGTGSGSGNSTPATTDWTAWFTQTSIGSIPNWALVAGAAVLLFGFSGGGGKR